MGDHADYTSDCYDNPFVQQVVRPFEAPDRDTAYQYILAHVK